MFSAFSKKKSLQPPEEPVFKPEDFVCQACNCAFEDHGRVPRKMPRCCHNYCEVCLAAVFAVKQSGLTKKLDSTEYFFNQEGQIICPEDELLLPAHIQQVGELPKNFRLVKAIADRKQGHQRTSSFNSFQKSKSSISISNNTSSLKHSENRKFQPKSKQLQMHPSLVQNQFKAHRNSAQLGLRPPTHPIQTNLPKGNLYEHSYNQSPTHAPKPQIFTRSLSKGVEKHTEDPKPVVEIIDSDPITEETRQVLADRKAFNSNFGASIIDHIKDSSMKKTIETRFQGSSGQDWQIQRLNDFKNKNWKTKFMTYKKEKLMAIQESIQEEQYPVKRSQSMAAQPFEYSSPDSRVDGRAQNEIWSPEARQLCLEHQKPQELICIECRGRCCHTCALFGQHKNHDVREQRETVNEIQIRMEVLMEMYQQVDAQIETLNNPHRVQPFMDIKQLKENELKERISSQFAVWHNQLNQLELSYHESVHQYFKKFDANFDEEQTLVQMIEDEGVAWQKRICSILDSYSSQIEKDQEFIAYDILDNDASNQSSVESLYSAAEKWLEQAREKLEYKSFIALEPKYDQISMWFEPNFDTRVQHLCKIVDESIKSANTSLQSFEKKLAKACTVLEKKGEANVVVVGNESNQSNSDNIIVVGGGPSFAQGDEDLKQVLLGVNPSDDMDFKLSKIQASEGLEDQHQPKWQSESFKEALSQQIKEIMTQQQKQSPNQEMLQKIEQASLENSEIEERIKSKLPVPNEPRMEKKVSPKEELVQPLKKAVTQKESTSSVEAMEDEFSSHLEAAQSASLRRQTTQIKKAAPKLADFFRKKEARKVEEVENPERVSQPSEDEESKASEEEDNFPQKARTRSDFTAAKRPTGIGQGLSGIGQGVNKPKFNLVESFKEQAVLGDIDLSSKGLNDNSSIQLSQLIRKHALYGVMTLDISGNRLTDNGMVNVLKAVNDTQISRLVLSGNRLSEKCVEPLIGILSHNKHLETVYMQETQIQNRVARNKLTHALKRVDLFL